MRQFAIAVAFILFAAPALAQQAVPPTVEELTNRLSATESQRNQAESSIAYLQSQLVINGRALSEARSQVADLTKQVADLKSAAAKPQPVTPCPTPPAPDR